MQLPRGLWLLLYDQDAAQCSGGSTPPKGPARKAGRESDTARRGAGESGKARKTSSLGRRENRVTQLQIESNLRGKRSDPLHGANARPKAGAVPVARCWCEMRPLQACQHPSGERAIGRWRRTGRRGLTRQIPVRKRPGRSRYETESCACRAEWRRGAHGPRKRGAQRCATGKERVASAHPLNLAREPQGSRASFAFIETLFSAPGLTFARNREL